MSVRLALADSDDDREIEAVLAASIANYVIDVGERPAGAILLLLDEEGANMLTYCRATRSDFALAGARLLKEATDE